MQLLKEKFLYKKISFIIILSYFILPFLFFKNALKINSYILGSGDAFNLSFPLDFFISYNIKNSQFALWNAYNFSGYPIFAYPEARALYPISIILNLIFNTVLAYNFSIILHYALAGILMYLFLKEYGLSIFASFLGGLIFMFSGSMVTHRSHTCQLYTMVWLPLILFFLEKFRKEKRLEFLLFGSIIYSISFLGGNNQIFLYSSIIILFYIIYYSLIYYKAKNYFFLKSLLIFLFAWFMILAQLISSYELSMFSLRNKTSYDYFSSFSFSPKSLVLLFFPYLFGNPYNFLFNTTEYLGPNNYTETVMYFGIITAILFSFGVFSKNRQKILWIFILCFSFILVLGNSTPFYKIMYYIPIYNFFRVPARNWFEFGFAYSIICGLGFDYLVKSDIKITKNIAIGIAIFFSILLIFILVVKYYLVANF